MFLHAAVYGVVGALLAGGWMTFALGSIDQPVSGFMGVVRTNLFLVFPVGAVVFGAWRWRESVLDGTARFSQLFGVALAIGLVLSAIVGGIAWYYASSVNPDVLEQMIQASAAQMRSAGMPEEEVAAGIEGARASYSAAGFAKATVVLHLTISFLAALIASLLGRGRKR